MSKQKIKIYFALLLHIVNNSIVHFQALLPNNYKTYPL
jgi:hypothetical protein